VQINDPGAFASRQVNELDKMAKHLSGKKKLVEDQMAHDRQEVAHLDHQLTMIHERFV